MTAPSKDDVSGNVKCWFVRNEHGRRFGPAAFATLQEWARDGRIGPLNEISCDGINWRLACSVPEMEMDWVAALSPGSFYGPIHGGALRELMADGSVNAAAALFRRTPLDSVEVQAAAEELAGLRELTSQLRELGAEQEQRIRQVRERLEQRAAEIGTLRRQLSETTEKARLEIAEIKEQAHLQVEKSETAAGEARRLLREQTEQAQEQRRLDAARAAALEDELSQLRRELASVGARADKLQAEVEVQSRLRSEERSGFEKHEMAALEDARCAKERLAEMNDRITELEQDLTVAREAGMSVDDGMPGGEASGAAGFGARGRTVEYIDAEPLDVAEVSPRVKKHERFVEEADVLPPETGATEKSRNRGSATETASGAKTATGLSMSALEAQARRELEMLGAGAKMFFSKNKK